MSKNEKVEKLELPQELKEKAYGLTSSELKQIDIVDLSSDEKQEEALLKIFELRQIEDIDAYDWNVLLIFLVEIKEKTISIWEEDGTFRPIPKQLEAAIKPLTFREKRELRTKYEIVLDINSTNVEEAYGALIKVLNVTEPKTLPIYGKLSFVFRVTIATNNITNTDLGKK